MGSWKKTGEGGVPPWWSRSGVSRWPVLDTSLRFHMQLFERPKPQCPSSLPPLSPEPPILQCVPFLFSLSVGGAWWGWRWEDKLCGTSRHLPWRINGGRNWGGMLITDRSQSPPSLCLRAGEREAQISGCKQVLAWTRGWRWRMTWV